MLPQDIIAAKRDGLRLSEAQIQAFVRGTSDGHWGDGQVAALAMAIVLRGMERDETVALTQAMAHSGAVLDWRAQGFAGPVLDKHSTGGVGDKVSLMLAPMVAAAAADLVAGAGADQAIVPMLSGRGLGHTGGTLDKLEALPGYTVNPDEAMLRRALREAGCAIFGASAALAPADRRLYAIRDLTATVASVPLITASILSKKLAAGLSALVLDVKVGSGAFLPTLAEARALATSMVEVAQGAGLRAMALLTDMDSVLGHHAGNALEVAEAIDFLTGVRREPRLLGVTLALAAQVLVLGRVCSDLESAQQHLRQVLDTGQAAERFARMVAALGGPRDVLRDAQLAVAPVQLVVGAPRDGFVQRVDVRALGQAVVALGGGRRASGDAVDARVGLAEVAGLGQRVRAGEPLALVHAAHEEAARAAAATVVAAFTLGDVASPRPPVVLETLASAGVARPQ